MKKILLSVLFIFFLASSVQAGPIDLLRSFVKVENSSGVVINESTTDDVKYGFILTARHVVQGTYEREENVEKNISLTFFNYDERGVIIEIKKTIGRILEYSTEKEDYAIIGSVLPQFSVSCKCVKENVEKVGDSIFIVGAHNGNPYWFSNGIISQVRPKDLENENQRLGHNADVWFGASGGPVFDKDESLIGVNSSVSWVEKPVPQVLHQIAWSIPLDLIYSTLTEEKVKQYFNIKS